MEVEQVVVCPTCLTHIDLGERCPSKVGLGQCMEQVGHDGWHWSDVGANPAILRWTGVYVTRSCPGRLNLHKWCKKPAGHDGAHNDGHGMTFGDPEDDDE